MDTVQPLQEDGALLANVVGVLLVATAIPELVTVVQPLRLHQHLETLRTTRLSHTVMSLKCTVFEGRLTSNVR